MAKETTSFVYGTYIGAKPERVFEAITMPDIARRYWGHENVSDWRPGSTWEHARDNADRTVGIVGRVVEHTPPPRLVTTWASASEADDRAKHSRVSYDIVPYDEIARLTVSHDELVPGSAMAAGIAKGWPSSFLA